MLDSFLDYLQFEKRYSDHTLISYKNDLKQFGYWLQNHHPDTPIEQADFYLLRSWFASLLQSGVLPVSITRKMSALHSYYKFLMRKGLLAADPMEKIKPPKVRRKKPVFARETDIVGMLETFGFENTFEGSRDKLIIEMIYGTGIRLSELIGLLHADLDLYNQTIKVLGKGNKERLIPIHQNLEKTIKEYLEHKQMRCGVLLPADNLLVIDSLEPMYPMFVYRCVKNLLTQLPNMERHSPHVLRHTFATHLLTKGADLNAIKDLLGHESLAATQIYTHNSLEKLRADYLKAHPKSGK